MEECTTQINNMLKEKVSEGSVDLSLNWSSSSLEEDDSIIEEKGKHEASDEIKEVGSSEE